jgi:hypothetical protein
MAAPVRQTGMPADWRRTKETRRYADGTQVVIDSSTGEVLQKRDRTARQIFSGVFGRSNKPAPTQTVTKGVTGAPRTS